MNKTIAQKLKAYNSRGHQIDKTGRGEAALKVTDILGEVLTLRDYAYFKLTDDDGNQVTRGFCIYEEYPDNYFWASNSQIEFFKEMENDGGEEDFRDALTTDHVCMQLDKVPRGKGKKGSYFKLTLIDLDDADEPNEDESAE